MQQKKKNKKQKKGGDDGDEGGQPSKKAKVCSDAQAVVSAATTKHKLSSLRFQRSPKRSDPCPR